MRVLSYLSALFLIMLVGCSDQSEETAPTQTTAPEATLDFVLITEGATSGVQTDMTSIYRLDTQEAWHKFWLEHSQNIQPSEAAPTINFDKDMVVAIVDADQPSSGYQLTIDQLQAVDDKLYVFATRTQPGAGCVSLGMISQPFVIIQLPKADLIPELRLSTKTVPCE